MLRAFIKQYAEAVGLEPEKLFEEFNSEIPIHMQEDIPEQLSRVNTKIIVGKGVLSFRCIAQITYCDCCYWCYLFLYGIYLLKEYRK